MTSSTLFFVLQLFAALGCGLIAGVFFAFSTFVMSALARLQPAQGIAALQSINITVYNPWFMGTFLGTTVACLFLAVSSLLKWQQPGAAYLLVGRVLVTIVFNVPLNDALAVVDPSSADGASLWSRFLPNWTNWNHVRTVAALAAAALFTISLSDRVVQL
jgi:uncharacterized membrane protein